jgi:glycosyltransferase involved in cell wall biosynthesis
VQSYYARDYVRAHTQLEGLRRLQHVTVREARNQLTNPLRYLETLAKLIWLRLRHHPDIYVLGFRGVELFWPVRLLTLGRPLVLDHMMSPYDSLVNERRTIRATSLPARLTFALERSVIRAASAILTDTSRHADYFANLYQRPRSELFELPVGAFEQPISPIAAELPLRRKANSLLVLYFGTFLPLHGVDVILRAAGLLRDLPVHFLLIGGHNRELGTYYQLQERLDLQNISHRVQWAPPELISAMIVEADLNLGGPFGDTEQARRVITGKTLWALSLGAPVIVGKIDGDYGFEDRGNSLLVPQRDPEALAGAIRWAYDHRERLPAIGRDGRRLYEERFSIDVIGRTLDAILSGLLEPAARS